MIEPTPVTLGKYDVVRELAAGSTSRVFLGIDPFAGREVALKVALPSVLRDPTTGTQFRHLFFNEVKVAGMLKHQNIVSIYDVGVEGEFCFMAMELVSGGRTLGDFSTPARLLPIVDVVQIAYKCAVALDHAHRQGVLHRDIKPRNILLAESREVKVADFGASLMKGMETGNRDTTPCIGSPLYMSPEQIRNEGVSDSSDIFSLGVVIYQLLTGQQPFSGKTLDEIGRQIVSHEPTPVTRLRPNAPAVLERILRRALKKNPRHRYGRAMDLAGDLSLAFDDLALPDAALAEDEKVTILRDLHFFSEFSDTEIREAVGASTWKQYEPGQTVIVEGEMDTSFYVLVSGRVSVRKGGRVVGAFGGGMCFGEMGFITGERRTATVVADSDAWVMKCSPPLIRRTSTACQLRFNSMFLNTVATRLRLTTEELSELRGRIQDDDVPHPEREASPGVDGAA